MSDDAVAALRSFNRSFTPRIGVLDESFLDTGRPLAVARLLFEIGVGDVTVQDLRHRLGVDSGYLSRLLRRLEDDDLVALHDDPFDGRRRIVTLTDAGRRDWEVLDMRSDEIAHRIVDPLTAEQRSELVAALRAADRLLRLTTISVRVTEPDAPGSLAAMGAYFTELAERFPGGFEVGNGFDDEIDSMRAPSGAFVVVDDDGATRGCGGLHRIDDTTAEIKRMWLHPELRGLGVGKLLLARLESVAAELGYGVVVLDTNSVLTHAIAMYEGAGYEAIERYNDNQYAQHWFRKEMA